MRALEPLASMASAAVGVGGVVLLGAELAEPDGGDVVLADVGPVFGPDGVEGGVGHGGGEPGLAGLDGAVVVGGVDELVGDGEADGGGGGRLRGCRPTSRSRSRRRRRLRRR